MSNVNVPPNVANPVLDIPNPVPGINALGWGFNVFSQDGYSFNAKVKQLIDLRLGLPLQPWTAPKPCGNNYNQPANVTISTSTKSEAKATTFATSSDFVSHFQASAGLKVGTAAISGSFSAAYSTEQQDSSKYSWALEEAHYTYWTVGISQNVVLATITGDRDWANLPSQFVPGGDQPNVKAFYDFFQKFGTHFIDTVTVGGTLYYYFAVLQAANYSSEQIQTSVSGEFHGLSTSVQAQANASWGQCETNWTTNRQSNAVTVPLTSDVISWVSPAQGTYDQNGTFAGWQTAVGSTPTSCKFTLAPISSLFSSQDQVDAINAAYNWYANSQASVQANSSLQTAINVNGAGVIPPPYPQAPGWQMVVLDRKTLAVMWNMFYAYPPPTTPDFPTTTDDQIAGDLQQYDDGNHILLAATSYVPLNYFPQGNLYTILTDFGAGAGLAKWNEWLGQQADWAVYALVGAGSPVAGLDAFATGDAEQPDVSVTINALLLPGHDGGGFVPTPSQPPQIL